MRGFGLQRQRPVADQLRIAAVLLRKIGRWMPQYAIIFFLVLLPQFLTHLFDTHNYFIVAFIGGVLTTYIVIFAIFFVKYSQYKSDRK